MQTTLLRAYTAGVTKVCIINTSYTAGFLLEYEDLGRMFDNSFPACPFFFSLSFFFFFRWRLARAHQFRSLTLSQDQSTVAQRSETTVTECSLTSSVSSFPFRFPHHAWTAAFSAHSDFVGSRVYACLGVAATCTFGRMTGIFYVPLR